MNREDIIKLAREAGLVKQTQSGREIWMADPEVLLEFGQLIEAEEGLAQYKHGYAAGAAAERKAMMQLFTDPENQPTQHGTVTVEYMQREIAAEREACAQVCEKQGSRHDYLHKNWGDNCAQLIRARGQA